MSRFKYNIYNIYNGPSPIPQFLGNFLAYNWGIFWLTNFGHLVVLLEFFPTRPKYVDQSSPVSRKLGPKFKFLPLMSASTRGFWRQFCHRTIGGLSPCLSSRIGGPSPIPQFWGNFFRNFGVPTWPSSRPMPHLARPWNRFATGKSFTCARKLPLLLNSWCSALPASIPTMFVMPY